MIEVNCKNNIFLVMRGDRVVSAYESFSKAKSRSTYLNNRREREMRRYCLSKLPEIAYVVEVISGKVVYYCEPRRG